MKIRKSLFYLLAALLGGCVPILSLHPLFTEKDVVLNDALLGAWSGDSNDVWEFRDINEPEKAYELKLTDNEDQRGLFVARLVKLKDKLFLDVMPKQFPSGQEDVEKMKFMYNAFFFVPAHTFMCVDSIEPALKMRWAVADEVEKLLEKDPNAVRHETLEDNIILTASTTELQRFVLKYADNKDVFSNEVVLHRRKTE